MFGLQIISQPDHLGTRWKLELRARQVMKRETLFLQEKKYSKEISALLQEVDFEINLRLEMKHFRQRQPFHFAVAQFMRSWKRTPCFFLISPLGCKLGGSTFMLFLKSVPQTSS